MLFTLASMCVGMRATAPHCEARRHARSINLAPGIWIRRNFKLLTLVLPSAALAKLVTTEDGKWSSVVAELEVVNNHKVGIELFGEAFQSAFEEQVAAVVAEACNGFLQAGDTITKDGFQGVRQADMRPDHHAQGVRQDEQVSAGSQCVSLT